MNNNSDRKYFKRVSELNCICDNQTICCFHFEILKQRKSYQNKAIPYLKKLMIKENII